MRIKEDTKKKQKEDSLAEGQQIRRQCIEDRLEQERVEQLSRENAMKLLEDYQSQIKDHQQMKDIERLKEEVGVHLDYRTPSLQIAGISIINHLWALSRLNSCRLSSQQTVCKKLS